MRAALATDRIHSRQPGPERRAQRSRVWEILSAGLQPRPTIRSRAHSAGRGSKSRSAYTVYLIKWASLARITCEQFPISEHCCFPVTSSSQVSPRRQATPRWLVEASCPDYAATANFDSRRYYDRSHHENFYAVSPYRVRCVVTLLGCLPACAKRRKEFSRRMGSYRGARQ